MNIAQIEANLKNLTSSFSKESFIYDLLLAYGLPKASITRLKKGNLNLSEIAGEVSWKKKLFFKEEFEADLHITVFEVLKNKLKHEQRFVVVTDYQTLLAMDTKTGDKLDIPLLDLPKHYDFFLPWAGMEKSQHQNENPADVKAAVNMAKLFDAIKKDNPDDSPEFVHGLNVFLSRLLFCFFAEDTHIFKDNQFTNAIDSHTQPDGSDLHTYLDTLFEVMNTPEDKRGDLPAYLDAFPYVNGGLFQDSLAAPRFTRASRAALLSSGDQDWSAINPDIFGSMFQAVIDTDQRSSLGQHYTSVPNIMKVIEPLFLNDLYETFEKAKGSQKKLTALLERLSKIKIFDPACGSGNFLIIAYKELRKLEMAIIKEAQMLNFSNIHLSNFYGIEIDDFAHEIAKLALWLAEHQMNVEFYNAFGRTSPTLPLKDAGEIIQGNATRLDWEVVCPKTEGSEVYIFGNPPYLGGKRLNQEQSRDMDEAGLSEMKQLDYICCWFLKASDFICETSYSYAFVTTSSICQGEQVHILWKDIFRRGQEIAFAYIPFPWSNSAVNNAGVVCTIVGIKNSKFCQVKTLFDNISMRYVKNISPYLIDANSTLISPRTFPLSAFPKMSMGSNPVDGKNLILEKNEYQSLIQEYPSATQFIRRYMGGNDFLKNIERYCLWIHEDEVLSAREIPFISDRINKCQQYRLSAGRDAKKVADKPFRFCYRTHRDMPALIFPKTTSSSRAYVPVGLTKESTVINVDAFAIYDIDVYLLGLLSSRLHNVWLSISSGKLGAGYRYSVKLSYNTFPFPPISTQRKNEITQCVFRILEEREKYSEKTLAEIYNSDKMPDGLREAHHQNDLAIERCYRSKPFESDEERLEYLFKLYEKMIQEEKDKGTLFSKAKKTRRKSKT